MMSDDRFCRLSPISVHMSLERNKCYEVHDESYTSANKRPIYSAKYSSDYERMWSVMKRYQDNTQARFKQDDELIVYLHTCGGISIDLSCSQEGSVWLHQTVHGFMMATTTNVDDGQTNIAISPRGTYCNIRSTQLNKQELDILIGPINMVSKNGKFPETYASVCLDDISSMKSTNIYLEHSVHKLSIDNNVMLIQDGDSYNTLDGKGNFYRRGIPKYQSNLEEKLNTRHTINKQLKSHLINIGIWKEGFDKDYVYLPLDIKRRPPVRTTLVMNQHCFMSSPPKNRL